MSAVDLGSGISNFIILTQLSGQIPKTSDPFRFGCAKNIKFEIPLPNCAHHYLSFLCAISHPFDTNFRQETLISSGGRSALDFGGNFNLSSED